MCAYRWPWSPTRSFPHPLVCVKISEAKRSLTNLFTYSIMEIMLWCETAETIDRFRAEVLELDPIDFLTGVGMRHRLKIPTTYFRSRALREMPEDWEGHVYSFGSFEETADSVHRRLLEDCQPCSLVSGELASLMARTKYTPVPLSPMSAVAVVLGGASEIEELQP